MTGHGLALNELPTLLDGDPERRTAVLEELDASLAIRIEHLEKQRSVVATLRDGGGPVDMPPDLVNVLLPLEAGRS